MKKFSEMNVQIEDERKIFDCKQMSITQIVNCEIIVHEYIPKMTTKHGEDRVLVKFEYQGSEGKFFTNSTRIKKTLEAVEKSDFPFQATIRCQKVGMNTLYCFT